MNDETIDWISSSDSFNFDFENNWYNLYVNCSYNGIDFNATGILQETNKTQGVVNEHSVGFTSIETDSLRQSCEKTIKKDFEEYKKESKKQHNEFTMEI